MRVRVCCKNSTDNKYVCIKRTYITLACANPNWTVWLCHTGKAEKSVGGCTSISVWC